MLSAGIGTGSKPSGGCSTPPGIRSNRVGTKRRGCRGWIGRGVPEGDKIARLRQLRGFCRKLSP